LDVGNAHVDEQGDHIDPPLQHFRNNPSISAIGTVFVGAIRCGRPADNRDGSTNQGVHGAMNRDVK
jgi:hypothetical protein